MREFHDRTLFLVKEGWSSLDLNPTNTMTAAIVTQGNFLMMAKLEFPVYKEIDDNGRIVRIPTGYYQTLCLKSATPNPL